MTSRAPQNTASTPWWSAGGTAGRTSTAPTPSPPTPMWRPWTTCGRCSVSDVAAGAAPVSDVAAGAAPVSRPAGPLHITFICSGNICRSPMAEKMFAHQISERGLADAVRVTSAGTGGWHAGEPADRRASHVLREHGYPSAHCAAQIDSDHLAAD